MKIHELRAFVEKVGLEEAARRTGLSERTLSRAKLSDRARAELEAAAERSARASHAAKERNLRRTRITEDVSAKELARAAGVSEKTAEKWKERGGAPAGARDAAKQIVKGETPYREPEAGKGRIAAADRDLLEAKMRDFVEAVRTRAGKDAIASAYRAFRRVKVRVRREASRSEWSSVIETIGSRLKLPDVGVFSKQRFRKS